MKKASILFICLLIIVLIVGCNGENSNESNVENESSVVTVASKEDFETYLNEITPIQLQLEAMVQNYDAIRNKSTVGENADIEIREELVNEVIPRIVDLLTESAYLIPHKEFRDTHELSNDMIAKFYQALTEIVKSIDNADASKMTSAKVLLTEQNKIARDFTNDMQNFANKYGVELK